MTICLEDTARIKKETQPLKEEVNKFQKISINETPIPQARMRLSKWGVYDPCRDKKNWIKHQIREQVEKAIECPVEIEIDFYMKIPTSTTLKVRKAIQNDSYAHVKKPDIDNLCILYMNCMNEIAYKDDRQIYKLTAHKKYDDNPRTEINIKWHE